MTGERADGNMMKEIKKMIDEIEAMEELFRGAVGTYRSNPVKTTNKTITRQFGVGGGATQSVDEANAVVENVAGVDTLLKAARNASSFYSEQHRRLEDAVLSLKQKVQEAVDSMGDTGTNRGGEVVFEYENRLKQIEEEYNRECREDTGRAIKKRENIVGLGEQKKAEAEKGLLEKVEQSERSVSSMGIAHMDNKDIDEGIQRQREGLNAARERFQAELDVLNAEVERFEESSRNTLQEFVNIESAFDQSDEQILQGGRNEFNAILDKVEEQERPFEALRREIIDIRVNGVSVIDKQADMREIERRVRETEIEEYTLTESEETLSHEMSLLRDETEKSGKKIDEILARGSLAEIYQTNAEETDSVRPSRINEKIAKLNLGGHAAERARKNAKLEAVMKRLGEGTKKEREEMVEEESVTGELSAREKNEKEDLQADKMDEGSIEDFKTSAQEEPLDGLVVRLSLQKETLSASVGRFLGMLRRGKVFSEEQFEKIFTEEFSNELAGMAFGEQEKKAVYESLGHAAFGLRCSFGKRSHLVNEKYTQMVLDCARKNPGLTLTAGFLDFLKKELDDLADVANRESTQNKKLRLAAVNKFVTENVANTLETLGGESGGVRWRVMALLARKDVEFSCSEETVGYIRETLGAKERMKPSKFEEVLALRKIATEKCSKDAHRKELAALLAGDKAFYQSLEDGDVTKAVSKAIGLKTIFSGALALLAAFPGRFRDQPSLADDVAKEKANEVWAEFIEDTKQVSEFDREDIESIASIVEEDNTVDRCERVVSMLLLESIIGTDGLPRHRESLLGYVHEIFDDMRGPGITKDPVEFFDTLLARDWLKELGHRDVVELLETILRNQSEDFLAMLEKTKAKTSSSKS
ncbi:MAG: uncharacterized protein A8A55_1101 [Amphiamblys sp. WSBS2006]|nr:MAG: uncharacterized protein A8A55_1101 [Amphiamblys sp. WSBS2006]